MPLNRLDFLRQKISPSEESQRILASKARTSAVGQIGLATIALLAAGENRDALVLIPTALLGVINFLRWLLTAWLCGPQGCDRSWYRLYAPMVAMTALCWAALSTVNIVTRGLTSEFSILLLIICAGVCAAATAALSPDRWLSRAFITGTLFPLIVTLAFPSTGTHFALAGVVAIYWAFLWAQIDLQSRVLHDLREGRDRFQALVRATLEGVVIHKDGCILEVNPAFERLFQFSEQDVIGKHILDFTPAEDREENLRALGQDRDKPLPCRGLRKDGSIFPIEVIGKWFEYKGQKTRVTCIQDLTARKQAEEAMRENARQERILNEERARAALESAKIRSEFLANMSHEIRTPLNAIIGLTDLLDGTANDDVQRRYFGTLKASGEALLNLVNDILDYSKIDAGKIEFERIPFDVKSVIEGQTELMAERAQRKGLAIRTIIDPALPDGVIGDPGRVSQVLLNLLVNAIKFTASGSVTVKASRLDRPSDQVSIRFEIQDTGIGISPTEGAKLFHAFTQADSSTSRRYGGTGLGLSICRKLVEAMGGQIGFESRRDLGSTFWFDLSFPVATSVETPIAVARLRFAPSRILVAEDNPTNQLIVLALLRQMGLQAHAVANGLESIEALEQGRYDLILMDCQMPEMDGFEATARIRELEQRTRGQQTPIVALTANVLKEDRDRCLACGMNDFLSKPIRREKLEATLAKFLKTVDTAA